MRKILKHLHFNHKYTYIASECAACYPVTVLTKPLSLQFVVSWVVFFSKMVATFNHVGGSFNLFIATGDIWIIPSFRIWGYVHVEHISCVITNCGQHQWAIPSLRSCWRKHHHKITMPMFRFVLQNFALPGCFPYILFYCYPFFLIFFRLVCYCSMWLCLNQGITQVLLSVFVNR